MSKGISHRRDVKKKPGATLKEKRLKKKEKRFRQQEHSIDQLVE